MVLAGKSAAPVSICHARCLCPLRCKQMSGNKFLAKSPAQPGHLAVASASALDETWTSSPGAPFECADAVALGEGGTFPARSASSPTFSRNQSDRQAHVPASLFGVVGTLSL